MIYNINFIIAKQTVQDASVDIIDYLDRNRDFLEAYIIDNVPINQLEKWLVKKMTRNIVRLNFVSL